MVVVHMKWQVNWQIIRFNETQPNQSRSTNGFIRDQVSNNLLLESPDRLSSIGTLQVYGCSQK